MAIEQDRGFAGHLQPIRVDDRVPLCLDDLGVLQADLLVLLDEVGGRPAHVVRPIRLTGDAGDTEKRLELLESLLARLLQPLRSVCHGSIFAYRAPAGVPGVVSD